MKVRLDGQDLCRFVVTSESDGGKEYVVDLCAYPVARDEDGNLIFNGACIATQGDCKHHGERLCGCPDFVYRCEPFLKKPANIGKIRRCKHVACAREYALTLLLPHIAKQRKNLPEDQLP